MGDLWGVLQLSRPQSRLHGAGDKPVTGRVSCCVPTLPHASQSPNLGHPLGALPESIMKESLSQSVVSEQMGQRSSPALWPRFWALQGPPLLRALWAAPAAPPLPASWAACSPLCPASVWAIYLGCLFLPFSFHVENGRGLSHEYYVFISSL